MLDLACGSGRHLRLLLQEGFEVTGVDRDLSGVADISDPHCRLLAADLERPGGWPVDQLFDGIVVTNYLHRPLFPLLELHLAPAGVLIYETFMVGNERHGRPANPAFLLQPGELRGAFPALELLAFREGEVESPRSAVTQGYVGRRPA